MQNIISLIFRYFLTLFPACAGVIPMQASRDRVPCTFPACAGVILAGNIRTPAPTAGPRMCGGDPIISHKARKFARFSPHVRG